MTTSNTQASPPLLQLVGRRVLVRLGATSALGVLGAGLYLLLAPSWYTSTLAVVPAQAAKVPTQLSSAVGAMGALGAAADLPALDLGQSADVERIAAVLKSTSVTDAVIARFKLLERYDRRYLEHARKDLWKHCTVAIDRKAKVVSLGCEDKDPKFAQDLLTYFGEVGNETFRRVSAAAASEEVRFLEQRVVETMAAADEAARTLRSFEEEHKIVDLEAQSEAVVSAMAALRSQTITKELELSYLGSFSSSEESTAQQLRQQLAALRAKARALEQTQAPAAEAPATKEQGTAAAATTNDIFPAALAVPQLRFDLEKLYRNRKLMEANLVFLLQRLESAKVNQARDTSTFVILDSPALPTYRSRPRRLMVLVGGLLLGALLGVAWVFGPAYVRTLVAPAMVPAVKRDVP